MEKFYLVIFILSAVMAGADSDNIIAFLILHAIALVLMVYSGVKLIEIGEGQDE